MSVPAVLHDVGLHAPTTLQAPIYQRIVIGVDFTPASLAAARWAPLYLSPDADAVLVHVVPGANDGVPHSASSTVADMPISNIAAGLVGFGETLGLKEPHTRVFAGQPSSMLDVAVAETNAELLILGRRADSARRRVGEPNVRERVARRTSASVLVVPEGTTRAPRHILAAIDDGPSTELILRTAQDIAAVHGIPLTVLRVVPPISGAYERIIGAPHRVRRIEYVNSRVERMGEPASLQTNTSSVPPVQWRSAGHLLPVTIRYGDPAREIVALAVALEPALIVVGKRGADRAPAGSLGSVTRALLAFSEMPVLALDVGRDDLPPTSTRRARPQG